MTDETFHQEDLHRGEARPRPFLRDVLAGLGSEPKTLPPKWLCDARGLRLREKILGLDEYYLTRAELSIFYSHSAEMALELGDRTQLVEYGNGAGLRTRILLAAMDSSTVYIPIAPSRAALVAEAVRIGLSYPWLEIHPLVADIMRPYELPQVTRPVASTAIFFPGSAIGHFATHDAISLLTNARQMAGEGGAMILGADLKKDPAIMLRAYDDPHGINARFNLNLLSRINAELGADFDLQGFEHRAIWNEDEGRVETHLESMLDQTVRVDAKSFSFTRGEKIRTGCSAKYEIAELTAMARMAGFEVEHVWTDPKGWFAELLLRAAAGSPAAS